MSNGYDNTNSGAIFQNDKKRGANSPTGKGSCETTCGSCGESTPFWVSSWKKMSKANQPFVSLAFTEKDAQVNTPAKGVDTDFDDDIPF